MKLSEHFTLEEMTFSQTAIRKGIDNTPDAVVIRNLTNLCEYILEPIRKGLGKPIHVSSGYRCKELNKAIGGATNPPSQHVQGRAADISVQGMSTEDLYDWIKHSGIIFDQLIEEFGAWVHISYAVNARMERLIARHEKLSNGRNKTVYTIDTA